MKKYLVSILLAISVGLFFGKFMLSLYKNPSNIISVMSDSFKVYFLGVGIYDTEEEMKKEASSFPYYIYMIENNKYSVYIGMTRTDDNLKRIEDYYKDKGYFINVREERVDNTDFLTVLDQYDILLSSSNDNSIIDGICGQILTKYEELVLNGI